ncbi:MAG: hypothetical protein GXP42_08130 [Chloroflexi bacterium]|nr:hypothetical protein [Chloroflexota bacterium]
MNPFVFPPICALLAAWALLLVAGCAKPGGPLAISTTTPQPPMLQATRAAVCSPYGPCLLIESSVAADFASLAADTWEAFLQTFAPRAHCIGDVRLRASQTLKERAVYDPVTATVTVQVPGSAAFLQSALVHEWAHHIEFQCPEQTTMRAAFLAAAGFPPDAAWRPEPGRAANASQAWETIPSEHYAEAAIQLVLGRRAVPTQVRVRAEAVRVLQAWAKND